MPLTSQVKASIKRASSRARSRLRKIDKHAHRRLTEIYQQARIEIVGLIQEAEAADGTIRMERLNRLRDQVDARLSALSRSRDELLGSQMREAAELGLDPFAGIIANPGEIADRALLDVINFVAADGLQLSDRIWRIDQQTRDVIRNSLEQAIIRGDSATRAARDFIQRDLQVPIDLQRKIGAAQAHKIAQQTGAALINGESPLYHAKRLFRTEINRVHGEAYMASAFESEDVIGTKFLLSPNHPKTDICDMHAAVNRYGLGKGVYPKDRNPWPAHPNTLSFTVVVFADEVTQADRDGKENRIDWLKQQSPARQQSVLKSRKKRAALHQGLLKENQIATPWRALKERYTRQGIDIDALEMPQAERLEHVRDPQAIGPQPAGVKVSSVFDPHVHADVIDYTTARIDEIHGDGKLPVIPIREVNGGGYHGWYAHGQGNRHIALWRGSNHKEMTAAHEIGHFIDHLGLPGRGMSSVNSKALDDWRNAVAGTENIQRLHAQLLDAPGADARRYLSYLLETEEIWARSYAQYIASKSGSATMRAQLNGIRAQHGATIDIQSQWADDDFAPVEQAIDRLFTSLGWIE